MFTLTLLVAFSIVAAAAARAGGGWSVAVASSYSAASTGSTRQGCPGAPPLTDSALSFASLIVPCGARVRFCLGQRCATGVRTDSGPYVPGRSFDLALGLVRALGFAAPADFGVRAVRWRPVG